MRTIARSSSFVLSLLATLATCGAVSVGCGGSNDDQPGSAAGGGAAVGGAGGGEVGGTGGGATPDPCPADDWNVVTLPRSGRGGYGDAFIGYDGLILYEDEIRHHSDHTAPRDVELIVRALGDPDQGDGTARIYGQVLHVAGDIPYEDLRNIRITSLESYHGKLYAGVLAEDSPTDPGGTDDTHRRQVYVTASVPGGQLVSNPLHDDALDQGPLTLEVDALLPDAPHLAGSGVPQDEVTAVDVQLRSAVTEAGLAGAPWSGPSGASSAWQDGDQVVVAAGHKWLQYRIELRTTDSRVSPVLQRLAVVAEGGSSLFEHESWTDPSDYGEVDGVSPTLSPGEVVLDNIREDSTRPAAQVAFVHAFQAPARDEPPEWLYSGDLGGPDRNFGPAGWPYNGVISMEVFQGRLMLNVGNRPGPVPAGATAGEFVAYDYDSGELQTVGRQYSEVPRDWWQEGNGRLRATGGLLINNGADTKMRDVGKGNQVPPGSEMYFLFSAPDQITIGNTPAGLGAHMWDAAIFADRLLVSRNHGVQYRSMPAAYDEHATCDEPSLWAPLAAAQHGGDGQSGVSSARFVPYGGMLVVLFADSWLDGEGRGAVQHSLRKVLTYDDSLELRCEMDFPVSPVDEGAFGFNALVHDGRLLVWNAKPDGDSRLYYTSHIGD
ncbi:MAG: hypothetical protein JRI68_07240 [Deltaproteobacteria bacterium]|nr:hypothetical protein [Deltaproteobacteria bacterium]